MSFLGKANFCTNGHSQMQHLFCVSQSNMLHVYHSLTHVSFLGPFSLSLLHQLEQLSHLQQTPVPLQFPLPDVVIATRCHAHSPGLFIFRDLVYLYQLVDPGQVPMCRASYCLVGASGHCHDALHRMAFCLSGKVVALHFDNSTANAYLCNQSGTVYLCFPVLACQILSLTDEHSITLIPAYIPTHLNVEADYLFQGHLLLRVASSPSDGSSSFLPLGSSRVGSAGILPYHSMPVLLHLGNLHYLWWPWGCMTATIPGHFR